MAKTSAHNEARIERQSETIRVVTPNKVSKFSERTLRLAADPKFAEGVATYNAATRLSQSFDSKADAEELAELLRGDANVRFAAVSRSGSRWNMNAERFDGPSTNELAELAIDGNELAFWALYGRLLPKIERNSTEYGTSTADGPGAVFDEDDAHQAQVEVLWNMLQGGEFGTSFIGKFVSAVRSVRDEARRLANKASMPKGHDEAVVWTAIRAHGGDVEAAAEDLAFNPERAKHMSKDAFYALYNASSAQQVDMEDVNSDPTQTDALASVESGFENEALDFVWGELTDREQEITALRYGLNGFGEHTADEIAELLGLSKRRINQLLKGVHATIAGRVAAPAGLTEAPKPARKAAKKVEEPQAPEFPVQARTTTDEVPDQTVAERRANPQDGVRAELRIRPVRIDHTTTTGILAGNEAWGDSRRRDYDAPKRTKAEPREVAVTSQRVTGSPLDEETEARLVAIKAARAARAKAVADDFAAFLKRLGS